MLNKSYNGETLTSYSLKTIRNWTIWTPPFDPEWPKTYIVICGLYSSLPGEKVKYFRAKNVSISLQGFRTGTRLQLEVCICMLDTVLGCSANIRTRILLIGTRITVDVK